MGDNASDGASHVDRLLPLPAGARSRVVAVFGPGRVLPGIGFGIGRNR
jgi:hypothetical protein